MRCQPASANQAAALVVSSSRGASKSTVMPTSLAASGSRVAYWESMRLAGMKWPARASTRAATTLRSPARWMKTRSGQTCRSWSR